MYVTAICIEPALGMEGREEDSDIQPKQCKQTKEVEDGMTRKNQAKSAANRLSNPKVPQAKKGSALPL